MKAGLIRPEPLHHLGDSPGRPALACQAVDRQASTGRQLLPERFFNERIFVAHGELLRGRPIRAVAGSP